MQFNDLRPDKNTLDKRDIDVIIGLADNGMSIEAVSRKIHMHRNTVRYHIDKIKRITGLDPKDFHQLNELLRYVTGE